MVTTGLNLSIAWRRPQGTLAESSGGVGTEPQGYPENWQLKEKQHSSCAVGQALLQS